MAIRKKSKEELQSQAKGFLEYASERGEITEKQKEKISKILGLNKSEKKLFLERLSKKFGKEIDISEKGEIEDIFKKKHINFEKIWGEYTKYLSIKSKEKYDRERVKKTFESHKNLFVEVNEEIIDAIMEDYSEDTMEKVKIFLSSSIYKESYKDGKIKNWDFLIYFVKKIHDKDDLKFLLDNLSLGELSDIRVHDYVHSRNFDLDILKNNILLLKNFGLDCKKLKLEDLLDKNIERYVRIITDSDVEGFRRDFDEKEEDEELKNIFQQFKDLRKDNLLEYCMKCGPYYIEKVLDKRPDIHYENNGGYTSKLVHMFGGDWDNNKLMHKYFGGGNFDFLAYLWTIYRTKNWKNNIDLAFERGLINGNDVLPAYEDINLNVNIAHLKLIDNNVLDLLVKRGVSKEDFEKFLGITYRLKDETLKLLLESYQNITIKELNLLEYVLYIREIENIEKIFKKYPEIKVEELALLEDENTHVLSLAKTESIEKIFEKYPEIKIEELALLENENTHILSSAMIENLELIFKKYPKIKIEELVSLEKENTRILSSVIIENLEFIFKKYPEIKVEELASLSSILQQHDLFMEFSNFEGYVPSSKSLSILDLFNDYTKKHDEVFKNIENKEGIDNNNWIDITGLYSANEYFEDDKTIPEEIKIKIRELLQSDESKDFIYRKLSELLKISLSDNEDLTNEEIALLAVLNKKGLWNMGQSESLAKFIYQINKLDKNYKYSKAFSEIKGDIKKFIYSHKKDSNELINSFYQVSTSLLERSPAIYRNVVKLLNKLDSKGQELFYKEIFPLYNVELFLGENPGQYEMLGKKVNNNVEGQLIPMHEKIKILLNKLDSGKQIDVNSLLLEEKNNLVENIKQLFKEKFGIKKIPNEFSKEHIESIRWHSIYLSNMHNRDEKKSAVLGYFLALKLDGKRTEFRAGKDFDPSEYMEDSKVYILREYLSKRSERNSVYKLQDIEEGDKSILQENESNTIIGNTNGITGRLNTIESNIKTLLDDDIYSERQKIIKKYIDKDLGKLLAKQFQKLSGKNIVIGDKENKILTDLSNELGDDLSNIKNVQKLQNECKPISAIVNFVNKILNEKLPKEIQDFENLSKPSNEHLELLNKIGINLENDLIISSNSYLIYIESGIRKGKNKLTQEEYDSLSEYVNRVNKELIDLYSIKDKLTALYEDFKNKIIDKYFDNTDLKERFESMSPYFFTKADVEKENIVSLMTNDLDIVIKNIRQCLGCRDKGCNNDTDLSFGCDDRFFITTSHREGDTSFADELVTLLPREPKEEGFTFVMDRIYGNNGSTDVLLNNINVIIKKINKLSLGLRKQLSIFIPNNIGLTLNEEGISKLKKQFAGIDIDSQEITVTVERQPITDSHHEFGGINNPRGTGAATISGYLIKMR